MFNLFLSFCVFINTCLVNLNATSIVVFLEFPVISGSSYSSVSNHISALKAMLGMYGLPTAILEDQRVKLAGQSLQINRPLAVTQIAIIDIKMLHNIVIVCDSMYMGQIVKAV